jgi:hypothetical protein
VLFYTGEDLKPTVVGALWAPPEPPQVCFVSNRYRYRSINELKRAVQQVYEFFNGVNYKNLVFN